MTTATKPTWAERLSELARQREVAREWVTEGLRLQDAHADYYRANEAWLNVMAEGLGATAPRIVEAISDVTVWAKFQGLADTTTDVEMKRYYQRAAEEALIRFDEGMAPVKGVFEALGSVGK
jgi:hypothetical protein